MKHVNSIMAIVQRDFRLAFSYSFALAIRYTTSVLGVFFFYYLGSYVGTRPLEGTTDYFSYTLVGFAFSQYYGLVLVALAKSLREDQLIGTIEPLMGTPVKPGTIVFGASLFPLLDGLILTVVQLSAGALFLGADFHRANWVGVAVLGIVGMAALQGLGIISATFVILFKKGDPLTPLLAASSFIFTGVFFPFEQLPWFLRWLSYCIPTTYFIKGARQYIFQGVSLFHPDAFLNVKVLLMFAVIVVPGAIAFFTWAVRYARRRGTLCHY